MEITKEVLGITKDLAEIALLLLTIKYLSKEHKGKKKKKK